MLRELGSKRDIQSESQLFKGVLASSFSFIPGVGSKTEELLWHNGVFTWDDAINLLEVVRITRSKKDVIEEYLLKAFDALERNDIRFFATNLPKADHWKLYEHFKNSTVFLDIETSGLSLYYDYITLVGMSNHDSQAFFVKDNNLDELSDHLSSCQLLVTFNGTNFDVPFLKRDFPGLPLPSVHLDLRYLLRSVGMPGPLKVVEKRLGIERPDSLGEMDGRGAVVLWRRFLNGDDNALETLLQYNAHDTANLAYLLDYCCQFKAENIASKMQKATYQLRIGEIPRIPQFTSNIPVAQNQVLPQVKVRSVSKEIFRIQTANQEVSINREAIHRPDIKIDNLLRQLQTLGHTPLSVGIDLSGSEKRPTGVCVLRGQEAYLDILHSDEQLLSLIKEVRPSVISIDSPLSLPKGRCCSKDTCECRRLGIMRECERTLKKRGINVYPCLIPSMQGLTTRGIALAKTAEELGFNVIESYPGAAQDIMGLPRKKADLAGLQIDLMNMGIEPIANQSVVSHHEIDALTSALVGYFYLVGQYEALGNEDEGYLIIPSFPENGTAIAS